MSSSYRLVISSSDSSSIAVEGGSHDADDDSLESEGGEKGGELDSSPSRPSTLPTLARLDIGVGVGVGDNNKVATYSPGTGGWCLGSFFFFFFFFFFVLFVGFVATFWTGS